MRWSTKGALSGRGASCTRCPSRAASRTRTSAGAIYVGWLNGVLAGLIAGTPFVLPGVLTVLGLSALYIGARDTTIVTAVLVVGLGHAAGHAYRTLMGSPLCGQTRTFARSRPTWPRSSPYC